uniref:Uncharacterized protein n=1 Tax=Anopheles coluzzii TaxID=1518534 RepID=A0A8W7PVK5_ANOCL
MARNSSGKKMREARSIFETELNRGARFLRRRVRCPLVPCVSDAVSGALMVRWCCCTPPCVDPAAPDRLRWWPPSADVVGGDANEDEVVAGSMGAPYAPARSTVEVLACGSLVVESSTPQELPPPKQDTSVQEVLGVFRIGVSGKEHTDSGMTSMMRESVAPLP